MQIIKAKLYSIITRNTSLLNIYNRIRLYNNWKHALEHKGKKRFVHFCSPKYVVIKPIKEYSKQQGIFSLTEEILGCIITATKYHYIPIIDLRGAELPLIYDTSLEQNAWELYFQQPYGYRIEDIANNDNVFYLNKEFHITTKINVYDYSNMNNEWKQYWIDQISKYIRFNEDISNRIQSSYKSILEGKKILGVAIRSGYRAIALRGEELINGHPVIETPEYYIEKIENYLEEWSYDSFFLCVDDREYFDKIYQHFGKKCLFFPRHLAILFENDIPVIDYNKRMLEREKISTVESNREYLIELALLSKCDSLYASMGTGHIFALLLNRGNYTHLKIEDLGIYAGYTKKVDHANESVY